MIKVLLFIVVIVIYGIYSIIKFFVSLYQERMVREGKGAYWIKVANSGKGKVYHKLTCGKCRSNCFLTINEAVKRGYSACSVCGGAGTFDYFKEN